MAAAAAFALAVPAGASARDGAQHRGDHVQVIRPTARAEVELGSTGHYKVDLALEEPDLAVLTVQKSYRSRLGVAATSYGAHFRGSVVGGRVTADFGPVGSVAIRFRPSATTREGRELKACEGRPWREESGRWVGRVSVRGEAGYFDVRTGSAPGSLEQTFRQRCHFKHDVELPRAPSLVQRVAPPVGSSIVALLLGTATDLEVENREGGREVALLAAHATGAGPGAEVEAGAFEYQGRMPVGRFVQVFHAPAGSLVTSLPGEAPATATLAPGAPFTGEASYLDAGPTDHRWTGTLAVHFPGLSVPLAGPSFFSSFCVISPLRKPSGCEFKEPNWQTDEEPTEAWR